MASARQCRNMRRQTAAEYPHQGGDIRAHIQQATAAKFCVIAKIGDRQRWNDELGVNVRERATFGKKTLQRFKMRMIVKHGALREYAPAAPRLLYAAFARFQRGHRRL